jgi:ADP-ribose pyrophosphatase
VLHYTRIETLGVKTPLERRMMMDWKVNHSVKVTVDRFEISVDNVTLPNQNNQNFSYIQFAKGVCILPITENQQVLCIKQYRHTMNNWEWELPAGMIDSIDCSPLDTAKRELEEETGYRAEHWLDLGSFYPSPGSTNEEIFLFAAAGLTSTSTNHEPSEQIELQPVSMADLKDLVKNGDFKHGAGLAAILRYKFMTD